MKIVSLGCKCCAARSRSSSDEVRLAGIRNSEIVDAFQNFDLKSGGRQVI